MRHRVWVALRAVFAVLFAASAALQWNDPDPLPWIALYGAATVACAIPDGRRWSLAVRALVALVALVWAAVLAPRVFGAVSPGELLGPMGEKPDSPVELGREMGGLLIVGLWSLALVVTSAVSIRTRSRESSLPG